MTRSLTLAVAMLALSACSPKFMVSDYFIPDTSKVVRTTVERQGQIGTGDDAADVISYRMQVCDIDDGQATNCKTTTVLTNVLAVEFQTVGGR